MADKRKTIEEIRKELEVSYSVALELCLLGGEDVDLIVECSDASRGLDECKARIVNERFNKLATKLSKQKD